MLGRLVRRHATVALLLGSAALIGAAAARAQGEDAAAPLEARRVVRPLRIPPPAGTLGATVVLGDTVWVGHRAGWTGNYWEVGTGAARPQVDTDGMWTWESPVHGDSLQGWWPVRDGYAQSLTSQADVYRPWWAAEIGNLADYVIDEGRFDAARLGTAWPGNRTFGVVGVWHSDPGSAAGGGVNWTALAGARSAWMGLRRHGDLTVSDPVTGNPFNDDVLLFGRAVVSGPGTTRLFPGYGSQMDQMLYRDVSLVGAPADSGVRITFAFRTEMSTGKVTAANQRTGWYDGDPLTLVAGNFISAEAGTPANAQAPIDSFQVYVGAPVEGTWVGSDGVSRPVYDPLRRWFNEVLQRGARFWKFARAGSDSGTVAVTVSKAEKDAIVAAAGAPVLRLVFRVHTNRGYDDAGAVAGYSSNGRGAAQVDDVRADVGTGESVLGDFEGSDPAKDIDNLQPAGAAWRSTGKPPSNYFHLHDLATLEWRDLCGAPGSPGSGCDMRGRVISMGDHDNGEHLEGGSSTPDGAGAWGMVSPTICLAAQPGVKNGWGLSREDATGTDYAVAYDIYAGVFDLFNQGNSWQWGIQSYPVLQADGTPTWGEIRVPTFISFNPFVSCYRDVESVLGLMVSANAPAPPDSVRIYLRRLSTCYRWQLGVCGLYTAGAYFDDVSFGIQHARAGQTSVDLWDWFQDTFPSNDDPTLPGTAAFDTTGALVRTGHNIAPLTGDALRFDVPGDTLVVRAPGAEVRVDLVFRVKPGPGSYVVAGVVASGLRRVPTSPAAVTAGDGSWWDQWRTLPGGFATSGAVALHAGWPGGWDPHVWMSARCDTARLELFPVAARGIGPGPGATAALDPALWMSAYHESDPHFATLGIARHRCFLVDTAGPANASNITCSTVPPWVTADPARTGYDGSPTTLQGTAILPDGLFTPGTHVEYFVRRSDPGAGTFAMVPDTQVVYPQAQEGSLDAHRWQQLSVLPDRWKAAEYGGVGMERMLVVDWGDRRGDETAWRSAVDSMSCIPPPHRWSGAGTGWWSRGDRDVNDPANFVSAHLGQPGDLWDEYDVKGGEDATKSAGTPGSRLAHQDPSPLNLLAGRGSRQGPSAAMLAAYYRGVLLMTNDLATVLGPASNQSADDRGLLDGWLAGSTLASPRVLHVMGDGFATGEYALLGPRLGAQWVESDYLLYSGNTAPAPDLALAPTISPSGTVVAVADHCVTPAAQPLEPGGHDVLMPDPSISEAVPASSYAPVGPYAPYVAGVFKPLSTVRPWISLVDGFSMASLRGRYGTSTDGRMRYLGAVARSVYAPAVFGIGGIGDICEGGVEERPPLVDYARLAGNPVRGGEAVIELGLVATDRVQVRLYDVSGRLVRTLADRTFPAGTHRLAWDGADGGGRALAHGVYFVRVGYAGRGFTTVRKAVVLR